jgi:hypothetical protein
MLRQVICSTKVISFQYYTVAALARLIRQLTPNQLRVVLAAPKGMKDSSRE